MASTVSSTLLSFGMVSAPVSIKKIEDKKDEVKFDRASPSGNPVQQVYVDKVTGEIVGPLGETVQGWFDDPKNGIGFHEAPADAVTAIRDAGKIDGIEIDGFIPLGEVPFERAEGAYFVAPNAKGGGAAAAKPLGLLRDALKQTGCAGIGKLTLRTLQRAFVVYEQDGGLILNTLAFAEDFAHIDEASECLDGVESDPKSVELATTLVTKMVVEASHLDSYRDTTREQKSDLYMKVMAGETVAAPVAAAPQEQGGDLEALLLASIGEAAPAPKKTAAKQKTAKAA